VLPSRTASASRATADQAVRHSTELGSSAIMCASSLHVLHTWVENYHGHHARAAAVQITDKVSPACSVHLAIVKRMSACCCLRPGSDMALCRMFCKQTKDRIPASSGHRQLPRMQHQMQQMHAVAVDLHATDGNSCRRDLLQARLPQSAPLAGPECSSASADGYTCKLYRYIDWWLIVYQWKASDLHTPCTFRTEHLPVAQAPVPAAHVH
jgi:hypothetical protein